MIFVHPTFARRCFFLIWAVKTSVSLPASADAETNVRLIVRPKWGLPEELVSIVEVALPSKTVKIQKCIPELPGGCRVFFDQWGKGTCIYPEGDGNVAAEVKNTLEEWSRQFSLDVAPFPSTMTIEFDGKSYEGQVDFVSRRPQKGGSSVVLKDIGFFVLDKDNHVLAGHFLKGVSEPAWDSTGKYCVFYQKIELIKKARYSYSGLLYSDESEEVLTLLPEKNFWMDNRLSAPHWLWDVPFCSYNDSPAAPPTSFRLEQEKWVRHAVGGKPIPGTRLLLTSHRTEELLPGNYIAAPTGDWLLRFPVIGSLLAISIDTFVGILLDGTSGVVTGLYTASGEKIANLPEGHYQLLKVNSAMLVNQEETPAKILEWLETVYGEGSLTDDWQKICRVYPTPPALPAIEACHVYRERIQMSLAKEFLKIQASTATRDELWAKYDGTALLKAYLGEHPEIRCPAGGTYSAGKGDQLVHCSIHKPGQRHD